MIISFAIIIAFWRPAFLEHVICSLRFLFYNTSSFLGPVFSVVLGPMVIFIYVSLCLAVLFFRNILHLQCHLFSEVVFLAYKFKLKSVGRWGSAVIIC